MMSLCMYGLNLGGCDELVWAGRRRRRRGVHVRCRDAETRWHRRTGGPDSGSADRTSRACHMQAHGIAAHVRFVRPPDVSPAARVSSDVLFRLRVGGTRFVYCVLRYLHSCAIRVVWLF